MKKPLISVIIPVYNSESTLKECLNSVVNQTYNNLQIIIINDGSTDASLRIIKAYRDKRIELINKQNGGVSSARNEGLERAAGDYIMFIDSDDYLVNNNIIEKIINTLTNEDVVRYGYIIERNGKKTKDLLTSRLRHVYGSGEEFLLDALNIKKDYGWYLWQYMFKKSLWDTVSFPNREILEDLSTIYKIILKASNISVYDEAVYVYRINSLSLAHNVTYNKCKDFIYAIKEAVQNVDLLSINSDLKALLKNNFSYGYITELLLVNNLDKNEKKDINKLLIENKDISNNVAYGKQRTIIMLSNIFGINFIECLLNIRIKIKE